MYQMQDLSFSIDSSQMYRYSSYIYSLFLNKYNQSLKEQLNMFKSIMKQHNILLLQQPNK